MLLVERGTDLAQLSCRMCHSQIQPGECVLVTYRRGKPSVMHAHICEMPLDSKRAAASGGKPRPFSQAEG